MHIRIFSFCCGLCFLASCPLVRALDAGAHIEKSVQLIEAGSHRLARSYLAPALIDPRISSAQRSRAYYLRGFSYASQGLVVSGLRDFNRALEFNPSNPAALFALARLYWDGLGTDKDEALALSLFAQADELGHSGAELFVALGHLYGRGVSLDLALGRRLLQPLAEAGNATAMLHLASSFRTAPAQPQQAAIWYRKAFSAGDPNALVALAFMYLRDELEAAEPLNQANELLHQAAAAGSASGMVRLAHHYLSGAGLSVDHQQAFAWFQQAADLGSTDAFVGLGYMFDATLVAQSSDQSAAFWYRRAAHADNAEGQLRWAQMLLANGEVGRAKTWFMAAANQDHVQGHNSLAWLLATQKDAGLRNGKRAVSHAQSAVQIEATAAHLDTLAAAYAETGQFDLAIATQQRAIDGLVPDNASVRRELRRRLQHYRQQRPWRE